MKQLSMFESKPSSSQDVNIPHDENVILYHGNVMSHLNSIPDHSIQLLVTSPPYNVGKSYESKVAMSDYLQQNTAMIAEFVRKLSPTGSVCWQVGNYVEDGEVYPLDIYYYTIFKDLGLQLRNRIVWFFGHGLHASKRFSGRYETILWFTKSNQYTFNLDAVRIPSKYPGKRHYKGAKAGQLSGNPNGKNPSDVWEIMQNEFEAGLIDIPNVKSNHPEKTIHPCQFPIELAERCILAFTNQGDTVFDPFCGVGSTLVAALKHGRHAVGSEQDATYCDIAQNRIEQLRNGTLKMREIGTPIHMPSKNDKIARRPAEWDEESL